MHDATTGETWYVDTTPSERKKKSARQLDAEIAEILTTPEEDFGARKRGGGTGEPDREIAESLAQGVGAPTHVPARAKKRKRLPIPLPFERKPQFPDRWNDRYHKESVPIDRMIATQSHVTEMGLRQYRLPTTPKHAYDLPIVYRTDDGRLYIADGHHRIVAALKRGERSIMARVVDIGDPDNPREPAWP
jgi:ParB-like nuclease domain